MTEVKAKKTPTKAKTTKVVKPAVVRDVHKIDATGQAVGRIATQVSVLLRGKNRADFQKHVDSGSSVVIQNASKMTFSGKKLGQKVYYHHSRYPGGLKQTKISEVFSANPTEVLKKAIWNMLPKNKLRDRMIKRLIINE